MIITEEKIVLRKKILAARRAMSPEDRARESAVLAEKLFTLPAWQAAKTVGLYASSPDEVATDAIITRALHEKKRVALPRVVHPPEAGRGGYLSWHEIHSLDELVVGSFGIREPRATLSIASLSDIDFLLVPGVAFDKIGNRLGYGGGFYDRVLADFTGEIVALAFSSQVVSRVPTVSHDRRVSQLIFF